MSLTGSHDNINSDIKTVILIHTFQSVTTLFSIFFLFVFFFYILEVFIVCLYVHHMQLSCGIKSILAYLLTYN